MISQAPPLRQNRDTFGGDCIILQFNFIMHFLISFDEIRVSAWFQDSAAKELRTALFWVITQQVVVISYPTTTHCVITQKSAVLKFMLGSNKRRLINCDQCGVFCNICAKFSASIALEYLAHNIPQDICASTI